MKQMLTCILTLKTKQSGVKKNGFKIQTKRNTPVFLCASTSNIQITEEIHLITITPKFPLVTARIFAKDTKFIY